MASLEDQGYQYKKVDIGSELAEQTIPCMSCNEGYLTEVLSFLHENDVCGECHRVSNQHHILPCSSNECCGDEEGMFHQSCMLSLGDDIFQCRPCHAAGVPLETAGAEEEESENINSEDVMVEDPEEEVLYNDIADQRLDSMD